MSQQTETIHSLVEDPPSTTLPNQVSAGGDMEMGFPKPISLMKNGWFSRIANPIPIKILTWATANSADTSLMSEFLHPFQVWFKSAKIPWFLWLVQTSVAYSCDFTLRLEIIGHSMFRGALSVMMHPLKAPSVTLMNNLYCNNHICDISGGQNVFDIPIPNYYTSAAKLVYPSRNWVTERDLIHLLDYFLCQLSIRVESQLVGSDLLPPSVSVILSIVPNVASLKLYGECRPPSFDMINPFYVKSETEVAVITV